jgi:hypothetical protein
MFIYLPQVRMASLLISVLEPAVLLVLVIAYCCKFLRALWNTQQTLIHNDQPYTSILVLQVKYRTKLCLAVYSMLGLKVIAEFACRLTSLMAAHKDTVFSKWLLPI